MYILLSSLSHTHTHTHMQPSLEQRLSQLVGISILITNVTGKLPKFIRLKSHGFAVRSLGENYIMVSKRS